MPVSLPRVPFAKAGPGAPMCPAESHDAPAPATAVEPPRGRVTAFEGLLDRDLEPGDDAGIAALRKEVWIGIASRHPRVSVFGIGDHVGEAPGTDRENPDGFISGVAECVQPGPSLRTEDEVAGGQGLFAVLVPEQRAAAENEEHFFGSVMHVHAALRRSGGEFVERCPHPSVVRPPKHPTPRSMLFALSVPQAGEKILPCHLVLRSSGLRAAAKAQHSSLDT